MSELTDSDYKNILKLYDLPIPKSKRLLKKQAEKIMADKLCRCIKKIDPKREGKSIGICTKTLFNNRGYKRGRFSCKKKRSVQLTKTQKKRSK